MLKGSKKRLLNMKQLVSSLEERRLGRVELIWEVGLVGGFQQGLCSVYKY